MKKTGYWELRKEQRTLDSDPVQDVLSYHGIILLKKTGELGQYLKV